MPAASQQSREQSEIIEQVVVGKQPEAAHYAAQQSEIDQ